VLIGLTGGIGSGKSTVAGRWVELGATEIDADVLARKVVEPNSKGLGQVVARFGAQVLDATGNLDRAKLAQIAFASTTNRKDLEQILHPLIQELAKEQVASLSGIIVYTIPLLIETDSKLSFDKVVAISCPEETRISRLLDNRAMSREDALARISSQASDVEREERADIVIDSNCSREELLLKATEVFHSFDA
jgi:dephospho-CoA kinase